MSLPTLEMVNEVKSQLRSIMETPIGTLATTDIDRELTPILAELMMLGSRSEQNPTIRQLFDWLVHPQCTVEEFNYVVGPLAQYVFVVMAEHFSQYMYKSTNVGNYYFFYLFLTTAEVLAVKCPVLESSWEYTAWVMVGKIPQGFKLVGKGMLSDRLSAWIVHVVGDADICPNPYLRLELMFLMWLVQFDEHNQTQAVEAVMSACSNLSIDYISGIINDYKFNGIVAIFKDIIEHGCRPEFTKFGETLAKKLYDLKTKRLSSILHDVSYKCRLNPNNCIEPMGLHSLIALLNVTARHAQGIIQTIKDDGSFLESIENIVITMYMFQMLICYFKPCLQLPQLTSSTATFVMDVLELVLTIFAERTSMSIKKFNQLLQKLLTDDGSITVDNSPIVQEIISRYGGRLMSIRERVGGLDTYPMIYSLLNHA